MWDAQFFIHQLPSPKIALSDNVVFKVADIAAVRHSRKNEHTIFFLNPPSRTISSLPNSGPVFQCATWKLCSAGVACHEKSKTKQASGSWFVEGDTIAVFFLKNIHIIGALNTTRWMLCSSTEFKRKAASISKTGKIWENVWGSFKCAHTF